MESKEQNIKENIEAPDIQLPANEHQRTIFTDTNTTQASLENTTSIFSSTNEENGEDSNRSKESSTATNPVETESEEANRTKLQFYVSYNPDKSMTAVPIHTYDSSLANVDDYSEVFDFQVEIPGSAEYRKCQYRVQTLRTDARQDPMPPHGQIPTEVSEIPSSTESNHISTVQENPSVNDPGIQDSYNETKDYAALQSSPRNSLSAHHIDERNTPVSNKGGIPLTLDNRQDLDRKEGNVSKILRIQDDFLEQRDRILNAIRCQYLPVNNLSNYNQRNLPSTDKQSDLDENQRHEVSNRQFSSADAGPSIEQTLTSAVKHLALIENLINSKLSFNKDECLTRFKQTQTQNEGVDPKYGKPSASTSLEDSSVSAELQNVPTPAVLMPLNLTTGRNQTESDDLPSTHCKDGVTVSEIPLPPDENSIRGQSNTDTAQQNAANVGLKGKTKYSLYREERAKRKQMKVLKTRIQKDFVSEPPKIGYLKAEVNDRVPMLLRTSVDRPCVNLRGEFDISNSEPINRTAATIDSRARATSARTVGQANNNGACDNKPKTDAPRINASINPVQQYQSLNVPSVRSPNQAAPNVRITAAPSNRENLIRMASRFAAPDVTVVLRPPGSSRGIIIPAPPNVRMASSSSASNIGMASKQTPSDTRMALARPSTRRGLEQIMFSRNTVSMVDQFGAASRLRPGTYVPPSVIRNLHRNKRIVQRYLEREPGLPEQAMFIDEVSVEVISEDQMRQEMEAAQSSHSEVPPQEPPRRPKSKKSQKEKVKERCCESKR